MKKNWIGFIMFHVVDDSHNHDIITTIIPIDGNRGRGRLKKTWADCVKEDKKKWRMAGMGPL